MITQEHNIQNILDKHCFQIYERGKNGHLPSKGVDSDNYNFWNEMLQMPLCEKDKYIGQQFNTIFNKITFGPTSGLVYSGSKIEEL